MVSGPALDYRDRSESGILTRARGAARCVFRAKSMTHSEQIRCLITTSEYDGLATKGQRFRLLRGFEEGQPSIDFSINGLSIITFGWCFELDFWSFE